MKEDTTVILSLKEQEADFRASLWSKYSIAASDKEVVAEHVDNEQLRCRILQFFKKAVMPSGLVQAEPYAVSLKPAFIDWLLTGCAPLTAVNPVRIIRWSTADDRSASVYRLTVGFQAPVWDGPVQMKNPHATDNSITFVVKRRFFKDHALLDVRPGICAE